MVHTVDWQHYFSRQIQLPEITQAGQHQLADACAMVIGLGGLGCAAAHILAATGIGQLWLFDEDVIESSNLSRQWLYHPDDVGQYKALQAAAKLSAQFPYLQVTGYPYCWDTDVMKALSLQPNMSIILDCTDDFTSRYSINAWSKQHQIPLVVGACQAWLGEWALLNHTKEAPCYQCRYPIPRQVEARPACAAIGIATPVANLIGTMQAQLAILCLLNQADAWHNCWNRWDLRLNHFKQSSILISPDRCPHHRHQDQTTD